METHQIKLTNGNVTNV